MRMLLAGLATNIARRALCGRVGKVKSGSLSQRESAREPRVVMGSLFAVKRGLVCRE